MLIHIPQLDSFTYLEAAAIGLLQAHDEAEEGGFARTIGTDNAHNAVRR